MEFFFVGIACFISGIIVGDRLRKVKWSMLDWQMLKWNPDNFGYRIANVTSKVKKGDKVFIALRVDTEALEPGEEIQLFEFDKK